MIPRLAHTGTESEGCQVSKRIESGIVVAIGALTILTTATVIHDQNAGQGDAVSRFVGGAFKRVESFVSSRAIPATAKSTPTAGKGGQVHSGPSEATSHNGNKAVPGTSQAIPAVPTTTAKALPEPKTTVGLPRGDVGTAADRLSAQLQAQGWTSQDMSMLGDIVSRLVTSMNPSDWTTMEQALAPSEPTPQSEQQILSVLNSHLSTSDKQWLLAHFQGSMAFSKVDIQLLKEAFSELTNDMTPGEQQLVAKQASEWLVSKGQSGN